MFQSYYRCCGAGCRRLSSHEAERQGLRSCQGHPHPRHRNLRNGRRLFRRSFWDYPKSYVFRKYGFQYFSIAFQKRTARVFLHYKLTRKEVLENSLSNSFLAYNIERQTHTNIN